MPDILLKDADILQLVQALVSQKDKDGKQYFIDHGISNGDGTIQLTNIVALKKINLILPKQEEE
tara:strand:- start:1160 stop:1351 length:192 start_codon:yes stop_codon:yes gene_type:complete